MPDMAPRSVVKLMEGGHSTRALGKYDGGTGGISKLRSQTMACPVTRAVAKGQYRNIGGWQNKKCCDASPRMVFGPWTGFESQSVTLMAYARALELPQSIALAFLNVQPRMGSMYKGFS